MRLYVGILMFAFLSSASIASNIEKLLEKDPMAAIAQAGKMPDSDEKWSVLWKADYLLIQQSWHETDPKNAQRMKLYFASNPKRFYLDEAAGNSLTRYWIEKIKDKKSPIMADAELYDILQSQSQVTEAGGASKEELLSVMTRFETWLKKNSAHRETLKVESKIAALKKKIEKGDYQISP